MNVEHMNWNCVLDIVSCPTQRKEVPATLHPYLISNRYQYVLFAHRGPSKVWNRQNNTLTMELDERTRRQETGICEGHIYPQSGTRRAK